MSVRAKKEFPPGDAFTSERVTIDLYLMLLLSPPVM